MRPFLSVFSAGELVSHTCKGHFLWAGETVMLVIKESTPEPTQLILDNGRE